MKRIALITDDKYFFRKCQLLLEDIAEVKDKPEGCCLIAETVTAEDGRILKVNEGGELRELRLPARLEELIGALTPGKSSRRLTLSGGRREAMLDGAAIRLTESEYALLSLLLGAEGEFVSRSEILDSVFPGKSEGIVNVYIHYLREKLEIYGEKIIIASRESGYRIERKFLGGEG